MIRRAIERVIVNDDGNAVGGELDVDLESVGAVGHPVGDCQHRVLRREPGAAQMRKDERPFGVEDGGATRHDTD